MRISALIARQGLRREGSALPDVETGADALAAGMAGCAWALAAMGNMPARLAATNRVRAMLFKIISRDDGAESAEKARRRAQPAGGEEGK